MSADDPLRDDTIRKLKEACEQYRTGTLNWDSLRDTVYQASDTLGQFGERNIRNLLLVTKDRLEAIEFTASGDKRLDETLKVVFDVEHEISKWE
ncbi:MAG: hypothetical protein HY866_11945 [Chloroflexi bacterium]|nr:hypothetical protein [Chloroflexota bacterium]